ncbi:hypothetical protein [Arthrobacter bambusae]|uniref:hypothetical protein n=1 Tax=Arthrobacter bambusae TaxID=1338426 RepID=UPI002783A47A|nr:hypothetical protein [Arthrobacter bambusae]MDQ0030161.1 hypothetical protein [Arthrobacter bambusae]MDQ0097843.1 hypothetical protein [Arthrobacter bambusae]
MDEILQIPEMHLLQKVVVADNPEFVVELGGLRFRGYFTSLEIWNTMTRAHVLLPATSLNQLSLLGRLVDQNGDVSAFKGGNGGSDGFMSSQAFTMEPIRDTATRVTLQMCDSQRDKLTPFESINDFNFHDIATIDVRL